jgi:hypothetical protein
MNIIAYHILHFGGGSYNDTHMNNTLSFQMHGMVLFYMTSVDRSYISARLDHEQTGTYFHMDNYLSP